MPPLKQPVTLQDLAMDKMVTFFANYCDECSNEGNLAKLRHGIGILKKDITPDIPWHLSADFHEEFLQIFFFEPEFYVPIERPASHRKAVLEIIMDRKIVGLRCMFEIPASLDPHDARRIQGLKELNSLFFSDYSEVLVCSIDNFHLEDLTRFDLEPHGTDANLEVIGRNCRKLEFLNASCSDHVTDRGLRGLSPCSELRVVHLRSCPNITHNGISEFLKVHKKIHEIVAWNDGSVAKGFDCFSHPDSSVFPSIMCFSIGSDMGHVASEHLRIVAVKFPNLTRLTLVGHITGDLSVLESLNNLSCLDLGGVIDFNWDDLEILLRLIGSKILDLRNPSIYRFPFRVTQHKLDFIFKHCRNIEYLKLYNEPQLLEKELRVPPFEKLRVLLCYVPSSCTDCILKLEFGQMLNMEKLILFRIRMTTEEIESMILDDGKFPKLKLMSIRGMPKGVIDISRIRKIATDKNLNLEIKV